MTRETPLILLPQGEDIFRALSGARILITGGTGFFGCCLLEAIAAARKTWGVVIDVTVLTRDTGRFRRSMPHLTSCGWLSLIETDIRKLALPPASYTHLVHAATDTQCTPEGVFDRLEAMISGTQKVLDFADVCGIRDGIITSSGAVYGGGVTQTGVHESCLTACDSTDPNSDYAEGKRLSELLCVIKNRCSGMLMRIARCFAFVGPRLPLHAHFAVGNFVANALYDNKIEVKGNGTPVRSYLYTADMVVWLLTILVKGVPGRAYNVGSDQGMSIHDMAIRIRDLLAPDKPVEVQNACSDGKISFYLPDVTRARIELGLDVWTGFDQSIQHYAEWARTQR